MLQMQRKNIKKYYIIKILSGTVETDQRLKLIVNSIEVRVLDGPNLEEVAKIGRSDYEGNKKRWKSRRL